ncbi:pre-peptidase C-terminal domain-containing protein [Microbulbifer halophilus]|uniref:Serine protease n=1 Tax=Microbulbifer halophilus TaxID=453963 RepID=A0ABW5EDY2_9GAMM|nr:pre-peptidase C-terminal domain-containing protein [Microbulbifer halophilus]
MITPVNLTERIFLKASTGTRRLLTWLSLILLSFQVAASQIDSEKSKDSNVIDKFTPELVKNIEGEAGLKLSEKLTPQLIKVASKVNFPAEISSGSPNPLGTIEQDKRRIIIRKDGASFIKVHFSQFDIPPGGYVQVRSIDGSQIHHYGSASESLKTTDLQSGDDGLNAFSSLSIIGDTAIVEYFPGSSVGSGYKIEIDHIMQGFTDAEIEEAIQNSLTDNVGPSSTCGVNERRDVQCWADSYPTEFERSRPVARLLIAGSSLCTAWRVGSDNHMFTNNHCVDNQSDLSNTEVWFNYQRTSCGGSTNEPTTIVTGQDLLKTDYTLDYTLFTVSDFSNIESFGHFGLDVRDALDQEQIYIPQHGSGNPKELAIESDQNTGGVCRIDDVLADGRGTDTDMGYYCDTIGGSSGSPVLATSSNRVLALHHFGGCTNQGVRVADIWPQVSSYFGGTIPSGDNENPSGEPSANFSYNADQLNVAFSDQSTDSDGSIASHAWDFGDGNSSTVQNPSHSYAAPGSYNVSLTVTDSDGLSDSVTKSIQVSDAAEGQLLNGVPVTSLSGNQGNTLHYWIDVPSDAQNLSVNISGGTGDADLYVRFGAEPTTSTYDCRPYESGNEETCNISPTQAGTYYVMVRAYNNFSGVDLVADYDSTTGGDDGFEETNVSADEGEWRHYSLEVSEGASELNAVITGGTGDADLYVRYGSEPTTSSYDCRPYEWGNEETCTISNPQAGTWYISARAYDAFSGLTVKGESINADP